MDKQDKQNGWKLISLVFGIAILFFLGFGFYDEGKTYIQEKQSEAYNQGQIDIIVQIQQTGTIPLFSNETGNITIKMVRIQDLCKGVNQNE